MKPGDLIKFRDYSRSNEDEIVGLIVNMKARPYNEVSSVEVMSGGLTYWIFVSQIIDVVSINN